MIDTNTQWLVEQRGLCVHNGGQETQPNMSKQIMNVEWLIVVGYGEWSHEVHNDGNTVDVGAVLLQCDSQTKTAHH